MVPPSGPCTLTTGQLYVHAQETNTVPTVHTSTDEISDTAFLPLEQVSSLTTAEVEHSDLGLDVCPQEHTLHPVVEVTHVEDGTLDRWSEHSINSVRGECGCECGCECVRVYT